MGRRPAGRRLTPRRTGTLAIAAVVAIGLCACAGSGESADAGADATGGVPAATGSGGVDRTAAPDYPSTGKPASPSSELPTVGPDQDDPASDPSSQESVLDTIPGDPSGECVDADGQRDVRSGGIAAGPFDEAAAAYADGDRTVMLQWIPAHADDLPGLTVSATQISGGAATFIHEAPTASELVGDTGTWHYYLTELTIPAPGTWRLEAASGEDSGCFTITFG